MTSWRTAFVLAAMLCLPAALWAQSKQKKGAYEKLDYVWKFPGAAGEDVEIPKLAEGEIKMPWDQFAGLLEAAMKKDAAKGAEPPMPFTVDSAAYTCTAGDDEALVKGRMKVWIFAKGYAAVPLLRGDVAVESVKFTGAKAALAHVQGWIAAVAPGPASFTVDISGRVKVQTDHGMKVVRLDVPEAGSGTLSCDIAMKSASVKVQPGVITKKAATDKGVRVEAGLFPHGYLDLRWWEEVELPKEEAKKPEPRLFAEVNTLLSIGEGLVMGSAAVDYSIVQGEVEELRVIIPDDITVNSVTGMELKDWTIEESDSVRVLKAFLSYKVSGSYSLHIAYEKSMGKTSAAVKVPELKVLDVERETGFFGVSARTNVEISAEEIKGTTQIDPQEAYHYVIASSPRPVLLAFKYLKHPFDVVLDVKKHFDVPVLVAAVDLADIRSVVTLEGKVLTRAVYLVRNNMKQFLKLGLPGDSEVWSTYVGGKPVKPGRDDKGRILVPLESSGKGPGEMTSFAVEVVYLSRLPALGKKGRVRLSLLEVDLPVSRLQWSLYVPQGYKYKKFEGNVQEATAPFQALPEEKLVMQGDDWTSMPQAMLQQNVLDVANVQVAQQKQSMDVGVMPVKMEIPQEGKLLRFTKMLVIDEKPTLSFKYRKKWW